MTSTRALLLARAAERIEARLVELNRMLDGGDQNAWEEFARLAGALAVITSITRPEHGGPLMTTEEMARKLGIASTTLLRRARRGKVEQPVRMGERGRGAIRWRGTEAG